MSRQVKEFSDYVTGLAKQKVKLAYWIDHVREVGLGQTHGQYETFPSSANEFIVSFMVYRDRDDPQFPDYRTDCFVPFEYLEADDYKEYAENFVFEIKKANKDAKCKGAKIKLWSLRSQLRSVQKEIKELEKEVLE